MKEFITNLFNLEVNSISDLEIINENGIVFTLLTLRKTPTECPHCKQVTELVHDYRKRTINHSILNDMELTLVYNQRRMYCKDCMKSFPEKNPFVSPGRRISNYTILHVMRLLKNPEITFSMAAASASLSIPTIERIFDDHAGISTGPFPEILCIDEVYASKYRQKVYACVLVDFETNQIYDLISSRRKDDLYEYFQKIPPDVRSRVRYISMDMWRPYKSAAEVFFKNAQVCIDSFHVISFINGKFDAVRKRIMKEYAKDSDEYYLLKKYNNILRVGYDKIDKDKDIYLTKDTSYRHKGPIQTRYLIGIMLEISPELELSYIIKEGYAEINRTSTPENIESRLDDFLEFLLDADIPEFNAVRKTLKSWKPEIINSFNRHNGRRISNGPVESVNSRIKTIKTTGHGYPYFERFRRRVLYSLSDLSVIKF